MRKSQLQECVLSVFAISRSTKSTQELRSVLHAREFEAVPDRPLYQGATSQAAGKLASEEGGGFNPRMIPIESTWALAPERLFPPISTEILSFSASCSVVPKGAGGARGFSP